MTDDQNDLLRESLHAAADDVCRTMLGGGIDATEAGAADPLFGRIGVAGDLAFAVQLCLPRRAAATLAEKLLGMPVTAEDPLVDDAFGELTNLVVGGAKSRLTGHACTLGTPDVGGEPAAGEPVFTLDTVEGLDALRIEIRSAA